MIKFSDFDSQLLNMKVGKLYIRIKTQQDVEKIQKIIKNSKYDLILVTMEDNKGIAVNLLVRQGFHFNQVKIELSRSLKDLPSLHDYSIKGYSVKFDDYKQEDTVSLRKLVVQLSKNSRFASDVFPKGLAKKVYIKWLENSLNKKASDRNYLLVDNKKEKIIGITTVKTFANHTSEIGLMVVDSKYRGRGLGRYLLSKALRDLSKSGINSMSLKTEVLNIRALNFYISLGFKFKKILVLLEYFLGR